MNWIYAQWPRRRQNMINRFNQTNQITCSRNQSQTTRGLEGWSIIIRTEQKHVTEWYITYFNSWWQRTLLSVEFYFGMTFWPAVKIGANHNLAKIKQNMPIPSFKSFNTAEHLKFFIVYCWLWNITNFGN